jgi:hypothetical protein
MGEQEDPSFNILANSSGANKLVEGYKAQEAGPKLTVDIADPSDYDRVMNSAQDQD